MGFELHAGIEVYARTQVDHVLGSPVVPLLFSCRHMYFLVDTYSYNVMLGGVYIT